LVDGLEGQDGSDAGQIEAFVEELADLSEADEVVVAVAAGATLAARWADQPAGLVEAEVLGSATDQFGRYGDAIQAPAGIGSATLSERPAPRKFGRTSCIRHVLRI
jgi:hypothetical protein